MQKREFKLKQEYEASVLKLIAMRLDLVVAALDPAMGKTLLEAYKDSTINTREVTADNFAEEWDKMLKVIPKSFTLPADIENELSKTRSKFKKFNRQMLEGMVIEPGN